MKNDFQFKSAEIGAMLLVAGIYLYKAITK